MGTVIGFKGTNVKLKIGIEIEANPLTGRDGRKIINKVNGQE